MNIAVQTLSFGVARSQSSGSEAIGGLFPFWAFEIGSPIAGSLPSNFRSVILSFFPRQANVEVGHRLALAKQ